MPSTLVAANRLYFYDDLFSTLKLVQKMSLSPFQRDLIKHQWQHLKLQKLISFTVKWMFSKHIGEWVCLILQAMSYSQGALPAYRTHIIEGRTSHIRTHRCLLGGWLKPGPSLPASPCAGGYARTRCISIPRLFQFTTQCNWISNGHTKYQLAT